MIVCVFLAKRDISSCNSDTAANSLMVVGAFVIIRPYENVSVRNGLNAKKLSIIDVLVLDSWWTYCSRVDGTQLALNGWVIFCRVTETAGKKARRVCDLMGGAT